MVATSQVLSLKCPLSYMRLEVPCRSVRCTHLQCFDATSYLQLQEQGPQWLCPICNKPAPFEQLAVDGCVPLIISAPFSPQPVTSTDQSLVMSRPFWKRRQRAWRLSRLSRMASGLASHPGRRRCPDQTAHNSRMMTMLMTTTTTMMMLRCQKSSLAAVDQLRPST